LNAVTNALAAYPWKDVHAILTSISQQVQAQRQAEQEATLEAAE
jgi:hypothetical protein